jgi:hypothetical protein
MRTKLLSMLVLAPALLACAVATILPPTATRAPTAAPSPVSQLGELEAVDRLVSRWTSSTPMVDGQVECLWREAEPLHIPLTWGWGGTEHALDVELSALYTDERVYFLAQWAGEPPSGEGNTVQNKLTMHWRIPEAAAQGLDCTVVCHTAFADGSGHFVYANAETIPQGGGEELSAAGGWDAGIWTLEWSRPFTSDNPFDLQLDDRDRAYTFLVKVFERVEGRPDPVSEPYALVFEP